MSLSGGPHDLLRLALLFAVSIGAGAINSIAGGGTLLTFPTLILAGVAPITANATNTLALVPGSASAMWGYRGEIAGSRREMALLGIPSLIGGVIGAIWVVHTGDKEFAALIPWLIFSATALFIAQEPLSRMMRRPSVSASPIHLPDDREGKADGDEALVSSALDIPQSGASRTHVTAAVNLSFPKGAIATGSGRWREAPDGPDGAVPQDPLRRVGVAALQFVTAIYGGFFGAGIGIMMLAALGFMGFAGNIHRANGIKNFAAVCINGVAAITFIALHRIDWPLAALMAVGAILGGFGGAGIAQKIGQKNVRKLIVAIGITIGVIMLVRH